ncbi:uncharacterized protein LOC131317450 [Rhododendron vialii]|uniref:uncharacterized protein LOC131317450 n=1 Tax=Rhododendron vialii TaxID=182163 RepID=UPI0026605B7C|nr:uncharacterized protein LOC131317450 [Rhododendron vialii]
MSALELIESHKANAEIFYGHAACKERCNKMLEEFSLPKGLMPLDQIEEMGFDRTTGFNWMKQKVKKQHKFLAIGQTVILDVVVASFIEERRMRKVMGVKGKDMFITVTVSDIFMEDPASGKISFKTSAGIARSFPVSAFELAENKDDVLIHKN